MEIGDPIGNQHRSFGSNGTIDDALRLDSHAAPVAPPPPYFLTRRRRRIIAVGAPPPPTTMRRKSAATFRQLD